MKSYTVYMHISPNSKRYIGITSQKPKQRFRDGKGYDGNKYFTRAIEKYGWDNFEHIIIVKGLSEDEAKWLEIELIREFDTTNKNKGYNQTLGGEAKNGWVASEETKRKMSEAQKGKHISEEARKKMSKNNGKYWKGKQLSDEHKNKISEARVENEVAKGKNNPSAKVVICITTNKIFNTAKEASGYYNCNHSKIISCCRCKCKSCGKLTDGTPLVWMYLEDYNNSDEEVIQKKINNANHITRNKVICLTTGKIFDSIQLASSHYNCCRSQIGQVCKGKRRYCGELSDGTPLIWMYLEDYEKREKK